MLNIRNFGLTFQVECDILQMLKRAERKLRDMEKIWGIGNKEFTNREEAREFLAMTWAKDPEKYLCGDDIMYEFNEYLGEHTDDCLDEWLLKLPKATEKQLKEMQNTFKQFVSDFVNENAEETVDDWLVEEIEEE